MLKSQDIVVVLKLLLSEGEERMTYASLSSALHLSPSEAHAAVGRALEAGLLRKLVDGERLMPVPIRTTLSEFLVHGVKYVWRGKLGAVGRGTVTSTSLVSVSESLGLPVPATTLVWPHPEGRARGETVDPLYAHAWKACEDDPSLHWWLSLLDVIRLKSGREAKLAADAIEEALR